MQDIAAQKKKLREYFSALRKRLCDGARNEVVRFNVSCLAGESFFVYYSVGSETDTHGIIADLLQADKLVCLPRMEGADMVAARYEGEALKRGMYGIPAPQSGEDTPCAVALVPLLAVDERGNRLGYGGGYYDKYFACHAHMLRVGLCFEGQVVNELPCDGHDMPLHAIITEKGVRFLSKT